MTKNNVNSFKSTIKVGTFFSGIGSPEKALQQLKEEKIIEDFKLEFFSEINKNAIKSYCAVHNIDEKLNLGDITKINGNDLPYCDLWIGGFPCQDISCSGKMKGFDFDSGTRSSLGWEMIRLLNEVPEKPKYVIFENVKSITTNKFKNTLNLFKEELLNLGYKIYDDVLNASDYEIPQNRERYFLVAILDNKNFQFPPKIELNYILKDFLEKNVDEKYFLTTNEHIKLKNNRVLFNKKNKKEIVYEVDLDKYKSGGKCGEDKNSKFKISSRLFSEFGNAPTLTASNTAENCKIVVEGGRNEN